MARPGFSVGLGMGPTSVSGETMSPGQVQGFSGTTLTTDIDGGFSGNFELGFNIKGYAAIQTMVSGFGHNLGQPSKRSWVANWHTGVKVYPMWHWQAKVPEYLHPVEPWFFVGAGMSYQSYVANYMPDEVAWSHSGASWRFGTGVEYYIIDYFKMGLEYHKMNASYDNFIFNYEDDINLDVDPSADTSYSQFLLTMSFQFGPPQEHVSYALQK